MMMKLSFDNTFTEVVPLDIVPEPFLFDLNWSAQELIDAMCRSLPSLHRFTFAPSANDAATHRPRRRGSFLALPPLPSRFLIGG
jgi:hypothetical protein